MITTAQGLKLLQGGDYMAAALYDETSAFNTNAQHLESHLAGHKTLHSVLVALQPAAWQGAEAPFTQQVLVEGLAADAHGVASLAQGAGFAARNLAREAQLSVIGQGDGSLILAADGTKPAVELVLEVCFFA